MLLGNTYTIPNIVNLPGQSGGDDSDPAFIMRVDTTITGNSPSDQFQLWGNGGSYTWEFYVDWGDNTPIQGPIFAAPFGVSHTYAIPGEYDIKITGKFPWFYYNNRAEGNKIIEIKNWGDNEFYNMNGSFFGSENLIITATDQPNFSNVVSFFRAFANCFTLTFPSPDTPKNWITSTTTNLQQIFSQCRAITSLDVSGWDVSNVTNFSYCFYDNRVNTSINTTGWDVGSGETFFSMFYQCYDLEEIIGIEDWRMREDITNVNCNVMFRDCRELSLDVSDWTVGGVANMTGMFRSCYKLGTLDLGSWDMSNVTSISQMFFSTLDLTTAGNINNWDVSNVTQMSFLFFNADRLVADTSSWDTSSVVGWSSIMYGLNVQNAAEQTGYNNWDLSASTGASTTNMFGFGALGDAFLTEGFPSDWDIGNSTSLSGCFRRADFGETNITCNITTSNLLNNCYTAFMEIGNYSADSITFTSNFDVSGVIDASYMFANNGTFSVSFPTSTDWGSVTNFQNFLASTTLSSAEYNALLIDIEASNQNNNVLFDAPLCVATGAGITARTALINDHSWTINDSTP